MRQIVLTVLFAVLIVSLNQDETWALPDIADGHLSEADLEEIIARGLPVSGQVTSTGAVVTV